MAYRFEFDLNRCLAEVVLMNPTHEHDVVQAMDVVTQHPEFVNGMRVLLNAQAADFTPDIDTIRRFVAFHTSHPKLRNCPAAVTVGKLVDFGMSNMFAILCQLRASRVNSFQDRQRAIDWLMTQSVGETTSGSGLSA